VFNEFYRFTDKDNMAGYFEKKCPNCKQRLRIPKNVGGVTMECPTCGNRMISDFKIGQKKAVGGNGGVIHLIIRFFEYPGRIVDRLTKMVFPR
jgi:predicted RNA-binding Zn-ribbon protein involved in translation (DUF1610 family)